MVERKKMESGPTQNATQGKDTRPTIQSYFGLSTTTGVAAYVLLCMGVLGAATALDTYRNSGLPPLLGGAVIGAAQAATLLLTGNAVGVSTAYDVAGQYFWRTLGASGATKSEPAPPLKSLCFAAGIAAGALAYGRYGYVAGAGVATGIEVAAPRGIIGGLVMVLGARLAGGCTSGHGISGMSMLGISSFVTVACMFAGGMGAAWIMG